jgi:peptide/nickel transport system substrate-binding protein
MKPTRTLIVALAALVVAAALAACGSSGSSSTGGGGASSAEGAETADWGGVLNAEGTPKRGGTLRIDQASPPSSLSPLHFLVEPTNPIMQVSMQVFSELVEFMPGSIDPQPGLAKSWEVSKDGLTYTFHLRQAKFSNGMPVTAADAKFTLDFARGPESLFAESMFANVKSVSDPDPRTLVVKLSKPTPALLNYLATAGMGIVPAQLVEKEGIDNFNDHPIGSGAFAIAKWRPEQSVELVRNPNYWRKGKPYLDKVELVVTQNDNTRILNVQSGTSDVADYVPFSQIDTIDGSGNAKVLVAPGSDMGIISVNNSKPPLDEKAVRRALNYATPVESIIKTVFAGDAPQMNTTMPKLKFWTDQAKAYPYDLEKAEAELAKSSVPKGFSLEVKIDGSDESVSQVVQIIQQSWAKIGVQLKITPMEVTALGEDVQEGNYELVMNRPGSFTSDVPVPDEFASLLFNDPASNNLFTYYQNPKTEQLAAEAVVTQDEAKRKQLFEELQVEAMQDPNDIPLIYTPNRAAVADDVHAFNYLLIGFWRLESVWKE